MRWAAVLWSVAMWIWRHIDLAPSLCEGIDGAVLHTKEHRLFAGPKFLSMWLRPRGPWQGRDLEKLTSPEIQNESDSERYLIGNFAILSNCAFYFWHFFCVAAIVNCNCFVLLSVSQNWSSFLWSSCFIMVRSKRFWSSHHSITLHSFTKAFIRIDNLFNDM